MGAFLSELSGKRGKLRKVGLPKEKTREDLRSAGGDGQGLNEVLDRAFKRKFARANGAPSPITPHVLPSSRSFANLPSSSAARPPVPDWSPLPNRSLRPMGMLTASQSVPGDLASLAQSRQPARSPLRPLPEQPVFQRDGPLPPRSSSLAATQESTVTTVFGVAISTEQAVQPGASTSSTTSSASQATVSHAMISPCLSSSSLPSAPPELSPPQAQPAQQSAKPVKVAQDSPLATHRRPSLSPGEKLPGLELGRDRPITPGRRRAKTTKQAPSPAEQGADCSVSAQRATSSPKSARKSGTTASPRRSPRKAHEDSFVKVKFGTDDEGSDFDELHGELMGQGTRSPNPKKVFGRA